MTTFLSHLRQQYLGALALFIVLGGTSYAAATNSIGSAQIKNGAIRSKDIRNSQVASADVKNRSLLAADFKAGQVPRGPRGAPGVTGPPGAGGPQGPPGISGLQQVTEASVSFNRDGAAVVAHCPAGKRAISGGGVVDGGDSPVPVGIVQIAPSPETEVPGTVRVQARRFAPDAVPWRVIAVATCANAS